MLVRAVGNKDSRVALKCPELDGSFFEQFYTREKPDRFAFMVDNTSSEADLEAINAAVLDLLNENNKKKRKINNISEVD